MAGRPQAETAEIDWMIPLYVIHSRDDGLIDMGPTETAVGQLRWQGADVEFVVLEGVTHYDTELFVEPLREAVPWIERVWQQ